MNSIAIISVNAESLINFRGSLIQRLSASGVTVYALAPDFSPETTRKVEALGGRPIAIHFSRTGTNPLRDFIDMLGLWRTLRRLKPEATLGYFVKPAIYGSLAAWLAKVPRRIALIEGLGYIFTDSGKSSLKKNLLRLLTSLLYKLAFSRADRVVFLNQDDITEFTARKIVPPNKTFCLDGIGVDLDRWTLPVPTNSPPVTFLLIARILAEKGVREFVQAATIVKSRTPQARFVLLGGIDSNPSALSRDEVMGWVEKGLIEWPGQVDDVKSWLAQACVFVLPSYREGLPRSTQEAMAGSRPVITTDVPGCRDTVVHERNGLLVPARDPDALATAMQQFIDHPELIEQMGKVSREIAEQRFDAKLADQKLINLLQGSM